MGGLLSTPITTKETEFGGRKGLSYGVSSMQGWRDSMEDSHVCVMDLDGAALLAVFDGHGGKAVSKFCKVHLPNELAAQQDFKQGNFSSALQESFHRLDTMLLDRGYANQIFRLMNDEADSGGSEGEEAASVESTLVVPEELVGNKAAEASLHEWKEAIYESVSRCAHDCGCTAIAALRAGSKLYVANAGDTRGVLCRAGEAVELSSDHKPERDEERRRVAAAGGSVTKESGIFRVMGDLSLSRAIGDHRYKGNPSLSREAQIITAHPDISEQDISPEDEFFIIACDGIWDVVSSQEAVTFVRAKLKEGLAPHEAASSLLDYCLAPDSSRAPIGCDNMTAIIGTFSDLPAGSVATQTTSVAVQQPAPPSSPAPPLNDPPALNPAPTAETQAVSVPSPSSSHAAKGVPSGGAVAWASHRAVGAMRSTCGRSRAPLAVSLHAARCSALNLLR